MTTVSLTPFAKPAPTTSSDDVTNAKLAGFPCVKVDVGAFPVVVSTTAVEMAKAALEETESEDGDILRIGVKGGGCAGFQYSLTFTDEVDDDDVGTSIDGLIVVTDTFSANYLRGTELDYVDSVNGAGFKFINPQAKRTCGCGSSFTA